MSRLLCLLSVLSICVCGELSPVVAAAEAAAAAAPSTADAAGTADADAQPSSDAPQTDDELQPVTVTATRTAQSIVQVPISVTALTAEDLAKHNVQSFTDYAQLVPDLSFAHSGFNAVTGTVVSIRGIQGPNTTSFYIDDAPVPVNIDPRVLDMQRIEVLRGPQGTLFGESSMGGAIRMITNEPNTHSFSGSYTVQAGYTTGADTPSSGFSGVVNIPVVADTLAVRMVGFVQNDGGWLTRTYLNDPYNPANSGFGLAPLTYPYVGGATTVGDQGGELSGGGSMTVRWNIDTEFSATARLLVQSSHQNGYPVQFGMLANSTTSFLSDPRLISLPAHWFNYQNYLDDRWYMPSMDLVYADKLLSLTSTSSYFRRSSVTSEADPEGEDQIEQDFMTPAQFAALPVQDHVWTEDGSFKQLTEEDRVNINPVNVGVLSFSAVVGYWWSRQWSGPVGLNVYSTNQAGVPYYSSTYGLAASGAWPNDTDWVNVPSVNYNTDSSFYGALNFKLLDRLTLSLGDRYYHLAQYNAGAQGAYGWSYGAVSAVPPEPNETVNVGQSPRYSLTYEFNPDASAYVSAARGFRAGSARAPNQALPAICDADLAALGIAPSQAGNVAPDSIWDYELGSKFQTEKVAFSGDVYDMDWTRMQQTFALACNYSVSANAGEAKSTGGEIELTVLPIRPLSVHADSGYENAHITDPGPGQFTGESLFLVPRWTASAGFIYTSVNNYNFPLTRARGHFFYSLDYSYKGSMLSNNSSSAYVVTIPHYYMLNGRVGIQFANSQLYLNGANLSNGRDNFGDYLTPGWGMNVPTVLGAHTPIPTFFVGTPRTLMLQYQAEF